MNSFGTIFKVHIYGESHGPEIGVLLDGIPAGIPLSINDFDQDISRRKPGAKGTTTRIEEDTPQIRSGLLNGYTTGAPMLIACRNENVQSKDYDFVKNTPRPGHADFVANHKFQGFNDHRGGGHFSGRLTLAIVYAGVVAKKILSNLKIQATIDEIHGNQNMEQALDEALANQDSVGGIISCRVQNIPIGWGEPFFNSLESLLAHAIFSIPAVKGIEFGNGFNATKLLGSENNDTYIDSTGKTLTNHAGGISGGLSNGNELYFRVAIKPTSSTPKSQSTFNMQNQTIESLEIKGRHDVCIALRAPVVVEAMTAIVLADFNLISNVKV
jgi:chorismate synthase